MDISKSVKIALVMKEMKKKDLQEKLAVSHTTITTLCRNKECSSRMIKELADAFGMVASEFIALGES